MTLKGKLKRIRKNAIEEALGEEKIVRSYDEKILIENFIKNRLEVKAEKMEKFADFRLIGTETIRNPKNDKKIYINKSDYISFAKKYRLKYEFIREITYDRPNKFRIFF